MDHTHEPKWSTLNMNESPTPHDSIVTGHCFEVCDCGETRRVNVSLYHGELIHDLASPYSTDWTNSPKVEKTDEWPTWREIEDPPEKGTL